MTGKICIRAFGALACVALAVTGWDAEAGWRRHCRPAYSSCCEPVCDPCCAPVCETVRVSTCAPVCVTRVVEPACCRTEWVSTVVEERVIVPAARCCEGRVVATESPSAAPHDASASVVEGRKESTGIVRNVSTSSAGTANGR